MTNSHPCKNCGRGSGQSYTDQNGNTHTHTCSETCQKLSGHEENKTADYGKGEEICCFHCGNYLHRLHRLMEYTSYYSCCCKLGRIGLHTECRDFTPDDGLELLRRGNGE